MKSLPLSSFHEGNKFNFIDTVVIIVKIKTVLLMILLVSAKVFSEKSIIICIFSLYIYNFYHFSSETETS